MDAIDLHDLVDEHGLVDVVALRQTAPRRPVDCGTLTDEELVWFGAVEELPDEDDLPRLSRLEADARDAALDAARLLLEARGELDVDPHAAEPVVAYGPRAVAAGLRNAAAGRCDVLLRRGGRSRRLALFPIDAGTVLADEWSSTGLHRLVLHPTTEAVRLLVDLSGPHVDATGAVQRVPDGDELDPPLAALRDRAQAELELVHGLRHADGTGRVRSLQLLVGADGTRLVREHRNELGETEIVVQPLARDQIAPLLVAFLTVPATAGDVVVTAQGTA